jgi:hypothetical protein
MTKVTEQVKNVCKIGQLWRCCKYLTADEKGFGCMKADPESKEVIDKEWAKNKHTAQGDNCEGVADRSKLNANLKTQ